MWNPFKTLFSSAPKKEEKVRKVTVEELALKQARLILEDHIDELAKEFSLTINGRDHQREEDAI